MTEYIYRFESDSYTLPIWPHEQTMLWLHHDAVYSPLDEGFTVVPVHRIERKTRRVAVVARLEWMFNHLRGEGDLLPWHYSLFERVGARAELRPLKVERWLPCTYRGEASFLRAGPGTCDLVSKEFSVPDAAEQCRLADELGHEHRPNFGTGQALRERILHDLRDLKALELEPGRTIQAKRRKWKTTIVEKLGTLHELLSECKEEWVHVSAW